MAANNPIASLLDGGGPSPTNYRPEDLVSIRDALTGLVGKQFTDLSSGDARGPYAYLRGKLGDSLAQKLVTHTLLFNQRPDQQKTTPEARVQSFYDMGSNDPEVDQLLGSLGRAGRGPVAGIYESPDRNTIEASKRDTSKMTPGGAAALSPLGSAMSKI